MAPDALDHELKRPIRKMIIPKPVLRSMALIRRFLMERCGSVMMITGLLFPLIAGAGLFSLDHMRASHQIAAMQKAADAAALASVRQLSFIMVRSNDNTAARNEMLTTIADGLVRSTLDGALPDTTTKAKLVTEGLVRVSLTARYGSIFGELGAFGENPFTVSSSAQTFGGQNVCFLALGLQDEASSIQMEDSARLTGDACEMYSGSKDPDSILVKDSAKLTASFICSAGGYSGSDGNYSSVPATDCAQITDPLAMRAPPPTADDPCDYNDLTFDGGTHTMQPGVYCGKTDIKNVADVDMTPGIYIFREGELHVHDTSSLNGKGVGLYFDDKKAFFAFMDEGEVKLSAPTTGPMAGMLIAARPVCDDDSAISVSIGTNANDRCESGRKFSITSSNVYSLLGTIHLPHDTLLIDTTMPVSEEAAFTIVVVGQVILKQSPMLVLNSDYDATDVPVPPGFREGNETQPRLVQ